MNNQPKINLAKDEREVRQCWPVFRELRPHIESEDEFVQRWQRQSGEGYQIAYVRGEDRVVAAAGYRFLTTMAWGHILYIDDLVATELSQGKGLGTLLLRFLQKAARDRGCAAVHLDTGYQRHRAHRAYLRNGFLIHCHHMSWRVVRD
ncbi:MAG TPA: GNAT family N-acetyltransferase [Terriglobales bacterium]|nr:GNAT family N-acetyltransferase [Terriglobales bacterium]